VTESLGNPSKIITENRPRHLGFVSWTLRSERGVVPVGVDPAVVVGRIARLTVARRNRQVMRDKVDTCCHRKLQLWALAGRSSLRCAMAAGGTTGHQSVRYSG